MTAPHRNAFHVLAAAADWYHPLSSPARCHQRCLLATPACFPSASPETGCMARYPAPMAAQRWAHRLDWASCSRMMACSMCGVLTLELSVYSKAGCCIVHGGEAGCGEAVKRQPLLPRPCHAGLDPSVCAQPQHQRPRLPAGLAGGRGAAAPGRARPGGHSCHWHTAANHAVAPAGDAVSED